jgi:hypothetical protein
VLCHAVLGRLLASGSMDATMLVWRTSPYVQLAADLSCDQPVNSLSWGPDSTSLAFTGDGAGVFVVDTSNAGEGGLGVLGREGEGAGWEGRGGSGVRRGGGGHTSDESGWHVGQGLCTSCAGEGVGARHSCRRTVGRVLGWGVAASHLLQGHACWKHVSPNQLRRHASSSSSKCQKVAHLLAHPQMV